MISHRCKGWSKNVGYLRMRTDLNRKYEHFSHVSSTEYFIQLLDLQILDWLRLPLYQGIATSAVAGSEGLIRASRAAIVQHINSQEGEERLVIVSSIIEALMVTLSDNLQDDRYAIPILELLSFLLDGYVLTSPGNLETRCVLT